MRRLLHLSDLHFGRLHRPALDSLERFLAGDAGPFDLIVVTGDWTQRAQNRQFREAAEFVRSLKIPVLTVPGNHDVPLYEFWTRFTNPLSRFRRHLEPHTLSHFEDSEVAVAGLNTVNPFVAMEGVLRKGEISRIRDLFASSGDRIRVIACHHPIFGLTGEPVIRQKAPLETFAELRPHLLLTGHTHRASASLLQTPIGSQILLVSAGSGTSNRLRGDCNSFNVIELADREATVLRYELGESGFLIEEKNPAVFTLK